MSLLWTWPVLILAVLKGSVGQSVDQTEGTVYVAQRERIFLNCSYQGNVYYLFWYIQHPGQPLKLFLSSYDPRANGSLLGFKAEQKKDKKDEGTFNMEKPASQLNDSAVYFCAVSDTVMWANGEAEQKHAGANETEWNRDIQNIVRIQSCNPLHIPLKVS
ncbi:T-cell receptor alpha chain V region RL-5 [Podarcis lilfordi]|nr:T-cell receptor alpha chain V region RL-5 [Podarcis lilfordi]